jgi:hypothetical protein
MGKENARPGEPEGLPDLARRAYSPGDIEVKPHSAVRESVFADRAGHERVFDSDRRAA